MAVVTRIQPRQAGPVPRAAETSVNVVALAKQLSGQIKGEVRFDEGSRHLYANDASLYRQVPIGVVIPKDVEDVLATLEICRRFGAPIVARGCGTGLSGQSVNVAVMIDFSKYMNRVLEVDPQRRIARVQPGAIRDDLNNQALRYGLMFPPDPATHDHCTLGGMIGNNSCGTTSVYGGKTVDNVIELDIVTYDGTRMRVGATDDAEYDRIVAAGGRPAEIYRRLRELRDRYGEEVRERYPDIPRRVSGYNLDDLLPEKGFNVARALVGTESTCVLVLEATVRLLPEPKVRSLTVLGYPDSPSAAEHVTQVLESGPIALEFFECGIIDNLQAKGFPVPGREDLPEGSVWVLVEHGGDTRDEAAAKSKQLQDLLSRQKHAPSVRIFTDKKKANQIKEIRKGAIGSTRIPGEHAGLPGWEDAAVAPDKLSGYLRDFQRLVARYGYHTVLFGHFGQGCIHCRLDLDLKSSQGIRTFNRFINDAADLVVGYGGSLSGEHGDGQLKAAFLPKMFGPDLVKAFAEYKRIWDPDGRMNPGKVVHPFLPTQNIRWGADYEPRQLKTIFQFPEDNYDFADAANRCFGVGKCRHLDGGTMCPSFMVTREEKDSTRGRARLLFEMMQQTGKRRNPWRDDNVKEALDLCLACKGCKGDCPVRVDMATYKAEFLHHYFKGRLRPRAAYALGLIYWWSGLAMRAPRLVNSMLHAPGIDRIAKWMGGVAPERELPSFAAQSFRSWFQQRSTRNQGKPTVLLWPDTFNNNFKPETAKAAVSVLEHAGFHVEIPGPMLCCGRPLYDYGMLGLAKALLHQVLESLRPQIRDGVPIVGLEPSCVAVFRDELVNLFPHDLDAQRLSKQTYLLSEFLAERAPGSLPRLKRKAIVQGHCHHKAVIGMDAEQEVMRKLGLDFQVLDSGCCGMAGSFGYEEGDRYTVSLKAGERVLLPSVRQAAKDTLVLADGFSCREQIEQLTDRKALHLAEVIHMAIEEGPSGRQGSYPEQAYAEAVPRVSVPAAAGVMAAGAVLTAGLVFVSRISNKRR